MLIEQETGYDDRLTCESTVPNNEFLNRRTKLKRGETQDVISPIGTCELFKYQRNKRLQRQ